MLVVDISNIMVKADIKILAENDEQEVVRELEEMFIDYLTITPNFFSLNVATCSQGVKIYVFYLLFLSIIAFVHYSVLEQLKLSLG